MKYCKNYQNVTLRNELSKRCWKNGTDIFAWYRVTTILQFLKNHSICEVWQSKEQENRYSCIWSLPSPFCSLAHSSKNSRSLWNHVSFCMLMSWLVAGGPWIALRDEEMVARGSNQVMRRLKLPPPPIDPLGEKRLENEFSHQ